MDISVIITTYNSPAWLEKVLWGYHCQLFKNFELIIADDGSTQETAELIASKRSQVKFPVRHVWQKDLGFRKCRILNEAILQASSDYIVFSDGDCIPRADFLLCHITKRRPQHFLSGGAIRLPMSISEAISQKEIADQTAFNASWLRQQGMNLSKMKACRLTNKGGLAGWMDCITPTKATWNGGNASGWTEDIMMANGFDERMFYGAEDRELGDRLTNAGVRGIQIRYSAACIHLDHARDYVHKLDLLNNKNIRKITRHEHRTSTPFGISNHTNHVKE